MIEVSGMQKDRQIMIDGMWALATDGFQWVLQRRHDRHGTHWHGVAFVSTTKDVLERCMRENGVPAATAEKMLSVMPVDFQTYASGGMLTTLLERRPLGRMLQARRASMDQAALKQSSSDKSHPKPRPRQSSSRKGSGRGR